MDKGNFGHRKIFDSLPLALHRKGQCITTRLSTESARLSAIQDQAPIQALNFSNLGFATITKKRLAPESCIVLQQIINVPDPIILFSGPNAFLAWLFVSIIGYR